jgi:hypothetical protein
VTQVPFVPLPSRSQAETLRVHAVAFAAANGEANPTNIRLGASSRKALNALEGGGELPDERPAYIVSMNGDFTGHMALTMGQPLPTGTVLNVVFEAETDMFLGWSLSNREFPFERLSETLTL